MRNLVEIRNCLFELSYQFRSYFYDFDRPILTRGSDPLSSLPIQNNYPEAPFGSIIQTHYINQRLFGSTT